MNLEEYFKIIGFHGSFDKPDLATLKLIHKQHVMSVPSENLSMHCGEKIIVDLEVIYDKIVRSGRGGWCLENNYLFGWVLREMDYDTTILDSPVYNSLLKEFDPLELHLINKVVIDRKAYIADVSYGMSSQIWEPLELISGKDQPQSVGVFRLIRRRRGLLGAGEDGQKARGHQSRLCQIKSRGQGANKEDLRFNLVPREASYFFETNHYLQTDPNSLFANKSICSLQTPTGFRALIGWTYSEVTYKPEEGVDVLDMRIVADDEIEQILWEKFNLKLQNKLKPLNKKAYHTI